MVLWLRNKLASPPSGNSSVYDLTDSLAQCVATLLSQLTSGAALYEVLQYLNYQVDGWNETRIRTLISGVKDASVLRAAVAVYKDHYTWSTWTSLNVYTDRTLLVQLLCESCFGYPPDKATSADIDGLRYYADTLAAMTDPKNLRNYDREQIAQRAREQRVVVEQYLQRLSRQL
jgi:hypothetical protein